MTTLKRSQLVKAAKELNDKVIDPESAIDTKPGKKNAYLEEMLTEAGQIVEPDDDLSEETWKVLEALGAASRNTDSEQEEEPQEEFQEPEEKKDVPAPKKVAGKAPEKAAGKAPVKAPAKEEGETTVGVGKTGKGTSAFKGPGIIKTISALIEASGEKGITKQEILEKLQVNFPDRDPKAMQKTINVQVPNRISKEKFPVIKKDDRYFKGGK